MLTGLGAAKVGDVRGIADTSTTMFAGQVVHGSDTIVTVGFASVGRKRLSLQYAQLEEL